MNFHQQDNEKESQAVLLEILDRDGNISVPSGDSADRIVISMEQSGLVRVITRHTTLVTYELVVKPKGKKEL